MMTTQEFQVTPIPVRHAFHVTPMEINILNQMKFFAPLVFLILTTLSLKSQNNIIYEEGKVSFLSSKNVYVKFSSTKNIHVGDTLFTGQNMDLVPVLVVENKSSSSTVCTSIGSKKMAVNDAVVTITVVTKKVKAPQKEEPVDVKEEKTDIASQVSKEKNTENNPHVKEKIKGRISVATYNTVSPSRNTNRMRYAFIFRGQNLKNSKLSIDSYITFRHSFGEWDRVKENVGNALKVFSLSATYDFDKTSRLTIGRKINPKFSSMGAIDGIQYEKGFGNFRLGAVVGSRPNYLTYGLNLNLLQFGAYISHLSATPQRYNQTTLGFIEQRNSGNTDRRFVYFQHSGDLAKGLNLFGSFELDLYENINNQVNTSPRLTNLFLALRYRLNKKIRLSTSYDNRRNIIYYESYKSFIDQFIDNETRQGLRVGITYRPRKNITLGVNASTRFQQSRENASQNINGNIGYSNLPFIKARVTARVNFLRTNFLSSRIFGTRLSKEIIKGKLSGELYYNWVEYTYKKSGRVVNQHIGGLNLSLKLIKRLSLNLFYESVLDASTNTYHRINARIINRF
ncbi:hypothetical protein N9933_02750 [bacterium]|nr:hypothetical protein [bacterium]